MLRVCSLGSGSSGNGTLVESHDGVRRSRLLIDCGFSLRELDARLAAKGLCSADLDGVFVTHEHADHIGSAVALARRERVPLWISEGTWRAIGAPADVPDVRWVHDGATFAVGGLEATPFTVPHDAAEPLQLSCTDGSRRIGVLTDLGMSTPHVLQHLQACSVLVLECNHDPGLLQASRYPAFLKARVGGRMGHLSNESAAGILAASLHAGLRHVVAAHLSEQNNTPALARDTLAAALGSTPDEVMVACPRRGFDWVDA